MSIHVAIVSSGRARNVPRMEEFCAGLDPVWYVSDDEEAGAYRYVGATRTVAAGGLIEARNRALDDGDGRPVLQLSDDLTKLQWASGQTKEDVARITMAEAVERLAHALASTGAHLAGAAPTANPFFSRQRISEAAFIVGDLMLTSAGCGLRFDTGLRLKEDYDYTLQHLTTHGKVARVDSLLASFAHRTNRGGAVAYRTAEVEDETIAYLTEKWPGSIRPNPRRPQEILMKWPPRSADLGKQENTEKG